MKRRDLLKASGAAVGAAAIPQGARATVFGAANPVLPQYDTWTGRLARAAAITKGRLTYTWTEQYLFAPGIPMVNGLPVPLDELPAVDWLLKAAGMAIDLVVNVLTSAPKIAVTLAGRFVQDLQQLAAQRAQLIEIGRTFLELSKNPLDPHALIDVASLQATLLDILKTVGQIEERALAEIRKAIETLQGGPNDLAAYDAVYATTPLPEIAARLRDDDFFVHLRLAGANPVLIRKVTALPAKFVLTDSQYRRVMGADDDLATAAASNRLYLLDYAELGTLVTPRPGKHIAAPIALLALTPSRDKLVPVAIQTGQDPHTSRVFLRETSPDSLNYWGWQIAKTLVQMADFNHHEICSHLARTHMVIEAFAVATHRQLAPTHPLSALLLPHFEGTLFINAGAALILLPPFSFFDLIFAALIETSRQATRDDRLAFDFYERMLPRELENRGVASTADLPSYPYRDDGLLLWNAIANWVSSYLAVYYRSDADVLGDVELMGWVSDLAGSGRIKGFRRITSVRQLADVMTMVIFTASAQHAAVNFSQLPLLSYVPATPGYSATPLPGATAGFYTHEDWLKMLPPPLVALVQMNILQALSSVYHRPLGEYACRTFPYGPALTDTQVTRPGGPLPRFRAALTEIEYTIQMRNLQRRYPYTFLLPSRIPASINI